MACTPLAVLPRSGPKYAVASRPGSVPGVTAPRSGFALRRQLAERDALAGASFDRARDRPPARARSRGRSSSCAASVEGLRAHAVRRGVAGAARHDGAAAGERAGAPVELARVAGDDVHRVDVDAELLGDDLRKRGEVPLPLRADAGRHAHRAARLHRHPRALVGPDAGAFDVGDDADADVSALGAQPRLLVPDEALVADAVSAACRSAGGVVAAVVDERREVLEEDLVVVREGVRRGGSCGAGSRPGRCRARARRGRAAAPSRTRRAAARRRAPASRSACW